MVTKNKAEKLRELSLLLTALGRAGLAVSEAETSNLWCLRTSCISLFVTHRKSADWTSTALEHSPGCEASS